MPGEHVLDFAAAIILRNDLMQAWGCLIFWNPWICTSISICSQSNCHNLTWASFWDPTWHLGEVHLFMLVTSQVSRTLIQRSTPLEGTFNPIAFQQEWGKKSNHMANMAYTPKNSHSNRRNDETRCWFCTLKKTYPIFKQQKCWFWVTNQKTFQSTSSLFRLLLEDVILPWLLHHSPCSLAGPSSYWCIPPSGFLRKWIYQPKINEKKFRML